VQVIKNDGSHGLHKARVNQYLSVIEIDEHYMISCRCGHIICKVDENYKENVVRKDLLITKAGMHINIPPQAPDKKFEWREFYCPQCALLLTNEVALEEDPIIWEVKPIIH
jgi:acetone carboxylase gamma subunit